MIVRCPSKLVRNLGLPCRTLLIRKEFWHPALRVLSAVAPRCATRVTRCKHYSTSMPKGSSPTSSPVLWGGRYAGFLAEYSPQTGALLELPNRYVPDELLQWGNAPTTWDVLVEESINQQPLQRLVHKVLPGVGCGLDSLDTIPSIEEYDLLEGTKVNRNNNEMMEACQSWLGKTGKELPCGVRDIQISSDPKLRLLLETIFVLDDTNHHHYHRLRVVLQLVADCDNSENDDTIHSSKEISSFQKASFTSHNNINLRLDPSHPIQTYWERRVDKNGGSTHDWIDANGHLDAGTVFELLGEDLRKQKSTIASGCSNHDSQTTNDATNNKNNTNNAIDSPQLCITINQRLSIVCGIIENDISNSDTEPPTKTWYLDIGLVGNPMVATTTSSHRTTTIRRVFQGATILNVSMN